MLHSSSTIVIQVTCIELCRPTEKTGPVVTMMTPSNTSMNSESQGAHYGCRRIKGGNVENLPKGS